MTIRVKNWERFQHADTFKKSNGMPPWIKLYQSILDDPEMSEMSHAELGALVRVWLWTARLGGELPSDPRWWRKRFGTRAMQMLCKWTTSGALEGIPDDEKPRKRHLSLAINSPLDTEEEKEQTLEVHTSTSNANRGEWNSWKPDWEIVHARILANRERPAA